jgi:HEPN domain-containing protein
MDSLDSAKEWLHFSEMDLQSARFLLGMRPVPVEIICYHCQQCAEKSLKAILVRNAQEPKRIHDLTKLLQDLLPFAPNLKVLVPQVAGLTDFASLTRYPHSVDLQVEDAQTAVADAQEVFSQCQRVVLE